MRPASSSIVASAFACLALLVAGCGGGSSSSTASGTTGSSSSSSHASASGAGGAGGGATSGSGGGGATGSSATGASNGSGGAGGGGGGASCPRPLAPDGRRNVLVSRPFTATESTYEVLSIGTDGVVTRPGQLLELGKAQATGEIAFTPDGKIAVVAQDDGTLAVVSFDDTGHASIVETSLVEPFYAEYVVMEPSGESVLAIDPDFDTPDTATGGIYRLAIGCDGHLTNLGRIAPSKTARALIHLGKDPTHAVVAAAAMLGSPDGDNAHLVDLSASPVTRLGGGPAFPDQDSAVSSIARTEDDSLILISDNSEFGGGNRVAVTRLDGTTIKPLQLLTVQDPVSIAMSPFGNAAFVVSGYGNAIYELTYDPTSTTAPFTVKGQIAYQGAKPQLPYSAVVLRRGALEGHAYMAELSGVRHIVFDAAGTITDKGLFDLGSDDQVGAIGVAP